MDPMGYGSNVLAMAAVGNSRRLHHPSTLIRPCTHLEYSPIENCKRRILIYTLQILAMLCFSCMHKYVYVHLKNIFVGTFTYIYIYVYSYRYYHFKWLKHGTSHDLPVTSFSSYFTCSSTDPGASSTDVSLATLFFPSDKQMGCETTT